MRLQRSFIVVLAAAWLAGAAAVRAEGDGKAVNGPSPCCPPKEWHFFEGAPRIKFKADCPKPICPCGSFEHFGYYPTCWAPWPFPPDYRHCAVPPLAAIVLPSPARPAVEAKPHDALPDVEEGPKPPKDGKGQGDKGDKGDKVIK